MDPIVVVLWEKREDLLPKEEQDPNRSMESSLSLSFQLNEEAKGDSSTIRRDRDASMKAFHSVHSNSNKDKDKN